MTEHDNNVQPVTEKVIMWAQWCFYRITFFRSRQGPSNPPQTIFLRQLTISSKRMPGSSEHKSEWHWESATPTMNEVTLHHWGGKALLSLFAFFFFAASTSYSKVILLHLTVVEIRQQEYCRHRGLIAWPILNPLPTEIYHPKHWRTQVTHASSKSRK